MTAERTQKADATRRRVLVAEDEFLVYLLLEEELRANGYEVVGPFTTLADAQGAAVREAIDLALLDINLGGEMVFPVADELFARKVPLIFLSGYASAAVPERYRNVPRLDKPYDPVRLLAAVRHFFEAPAPGAKLSAV